MVYWSYCKNCGTVVDEFESICSGCKEQNTMNKEPLSTFQNVVLTFLLMLAGIGAITTVWTIVELIALR